MKLLILIPVVVLAACGGGKKEPAPVAAPTPVNKPALVMPPAEELVNGMPAAGHPLWGVSPDKSPLWEEITEEEANRLSAQGGYRQ